MEQVKVVARFLDGKMLKGYTNDFFPKKPTFRVAKDRTDQGVEVAIKDLKGLFFVKDFEGNPSHDRKLDFVEGKAYQGRKAIVTFRDGEKIAGTVLSYDKDRPGFFLVPVDEEDNNTRIFVSTSAMANLEFL